MNVLYVGLLCLFTACHAIANDVAIVLSPHQAKDAGERQFQYVYQVFQQMPLGSQLIILNGVDATTIATFDIPDSTHYRHEKTRAKHNAVGLRTLHTFTKNMSLSHRTLGAMHLPAVLTEIARHTPSVTDIILFGSALYDNPAHPQMDMTDGAYPSDGFILAPTSASVFGTKGNAYLRGKRVHWALPTPFDEPRYGEAVTRFYHLYIKALGADLVSFTASADTVLKRILDKAAPFPATYQINPNSPLEMRYVERLEVIKTDNPAIGITGTDIPVESISPSMPLIVGIEWQAEKVDLDVYARPVGSNALYYGHQASNLGVHVKDEQTGDNNNTRFYERIEFHAPVDIDTLQIAVNLYRAPLTNTDITCILRVQWENTTYLLPLTFNLLNGGNKGKDMKAVLDTGENTPYSRYITIEQLLNASIEEPLL